MKLITITTIALILLTACAQQNENNWKDKLTPEQYNILWEKDTEKPFTGTLLHEERKGVYVTAGCRIPVFSSEDKYDSGTGWPSFTQPITNNSIILEPEFTLGTKRMEVLSPCGEHLGHVFDDGPKPTRKRYCINSAALEFIPE